MSEAARVSIQIEKIHVPEDYIRPLNEAEAHRLARLIENEGQKAPIAVYSSPALNGGKTPYTLVYGARRLRAMELLGHSEIEAVLRTKGEALMLAIADNFALPTLDALEQGEHVARFAAWWIEENGPVSRGGDRKSRFHRKTLISDHKKLEKSSFYKDLSEKFGISKTTAWRLLSIGNLHPDLRAALRGTTYAKDQKYLKKLTKYGALRQQPEIAAALQYEPDLDAVLRMADPATGRKGVGRQDRKTWNKDRFKAAWSLMSEAERREALEEIGAIIKPLPEGFDALPKRDMRPVPKPGLDSPLWDFCQLPEERRLVPIDRQEAWDTTDLQILRESGVPLDWVPAHVDRHPPPRAEFRAPSTDRRKKKPSGLSKEVKRMLDGFPPRIWWALKTAGVDSYGKIIRHCHHMDAERQEKALKEIWPGRDPIHIEVACQTLIHQQRKAYRERRKEAYGERQAMRQAQLTRSGQYKGLHPILADRLGDANKTDYELVDVLRLLDFDQQIEAIERLNIGRTLDEIYDWASEVVRDAA